MGYDKPRMVDPFEAYHQELLLGNRHPKTIARYEQVVKAYQLVERGASLRDVQMLLGHQSLETTAVYLDVSASHLAQTVALLDRETAVNTTISDGQWSLGREAIAPTRRHPDIC